MRIGLASTFLAALLLSGCIVEAPPRRYYAPAPAPQYYPAPQPQYYAPPPPPPPPEAFYDGYYGPFIDGYWSGGVFFFLDPGHNWHRDDGHHFDRGPHQGWGHIRGSGHRPH